MGWIDDASCVHKHEPEDLSVDHLQIKFKIKLEIYSLNWNFSFSMRHPHIRSIIKCFEIKIGINSLFLQSHVRKKANMCTGITQSGGGGRRLNNLTHAKCSHATLRHTYLSMCLFITDHKYVILRGWLSKQAVISGHIFFLLLSRLLGINVGSV